MKTQVLIIGGGVAGLTLAFKLARKQIDVIIVEKNATVGHAYKGELLQPKTIKLFGRMGILEPFQERWKTFSTIDTVELNMQLKPIVEQSISYGLLPVPYNYAAMLPHSEIKKLLMEQIKRFSSFTLLQPARFVSMNDDGQAIIKQGDQLFSISAQFIIGAEGVSSKVRDQMRVDPNRQIYHHDFLTVSFPAPSDLQNGKLIATHNRFLGLFPLPNQHVRTVYLIRKGEYKQWRQKSLSIFYHHYRSLYPELDGYVQTIQDWRDIQLMVPLRQHATRYVKGSFVLIGDSAHSVHPMAGEGMNLAIQGADSLGELLIDMYETNRENEHEWLTAYERIHKKRVKAIMDLSHLSGLVYGKEGIAWQTSRALALKQLLNQHVLLTKYIFNVSGLGHWPFSFKDSLEFVRRKNPDLTKQLRSMTFSENDDYPWKRKMR